MNASASSTENIPAAVALFMSRRDLFARHLGIELLELRAGYSRAALTIAPFMLNGLGLPHGAVIFALADFAFATACNSHGRVAVALSMDIHYLSSPKVAASLVAEAVEVRRGQRTGLYRIFVTQDGATPIAELHGMAYFKDASFLEGDDEFHDTE
ncbi:MAG TPA: hotdog fold thioesterase [Anaerolineales bacterium]|nr:hotdog fold thioesterase [Anaerolineales bacterium]